jgi:hypothetical protein
MQLNPYYFTIVETYSIFHHEIITNAELETPGEASYYSSQRENNRKIVALFDEHFPGEAACTKSTRP